MSKQYKDPKSFFDVDNGLQILKDLLPSQDPHEMLVELNEISQNTFKDTNSANITLGILQEIKSEMNDLVYKTKDDVVDEFQNKCQLFLRERNFFKSDEFESSLGNRKSSFQDSQGDYEKIKGESKSQWISPKSIAMIGAVGLFSSLFQSTTALRNSSLSHLSSINPGLQIRDFNFEVNAEYQSDARVLQGVKALRSESENIINFDSFVDFISKARAQNPSGPIILAGSEFEGGQLIGEDFKCGFFSDPKKYPKLLAQKDYRFIVDNFVFSDGMNTIKVIRDADFSGVDFRGANINIDGIRFENCNFDGAKMPSSNYAEFVNSNLQNTDWSGTKQVGLSIGRGQFESSVARQLEVLRKIIKGRSQDVLDEMSALIQPFLEQEAKSRSHINDLSQANFGNCSLSGPLFYNCNFQNSNFHQAEIIDNAENTLFIKNCTNLDLKDASYKFTDPLQETKIETSLQDVLEKLDMEKLKQDCVKIYGQEYTDRMFYELSTDGFVSKNLVDKLRKNEKIVVKVNINPEAIKEYFDSHNAQGSASTLEELPVDKKEEFSKNIREYLTKLFGEFNFEFVNHDYEGAVDHNINLGFTNEGPNSGVSFGKISDGNAEILAGGGKNPNYSTVFHELLHTLTGFAEFGSHLDIFEPAREVGMRSMLNGLLTYSNQIDLVIDGKIHSIFYDENYSNSGKDYVTPGDYETNSKLLEMIGRKKVDISQQDMQSHIDSVQSNKIFFQQFSSKDNLIDISPEIKDSHQITVFNAKDVVKHCTLPTLNLCIDNHNFKDSDKIIVFKPLDPKLEPKIAFVSGGRKVIKVGDEVLYQDPIQSQISSSSKTQDASLNATEFQDLTSSLSRDIESSVVKTDAITSLLETVSNQTKSYEVSSTVSQLGDAIKDYLATSQSISRNATAISQEFSSTETSLAYGASANQKFNASLNATEFQDLTSSLSRDIESSVVKTDAITSLLETVSNQTKSYEVSSTVSQLGDAIKDYLATSQSISRNATAISQKLSNPNISKSSTNITLSNKTSDVEPINHIELSYQEPKKESDKVTSNLDMKALKFLTFFTLASGCFCNAMIDVYRLQRLNRNDQEGNRDLERQGLQAIQPALSPTLPRAQVGMVQPENRAQPGNQV